MDGKPRVFVLGAGFSRAAGLPLATQLSQLLLDATAYPDDDDLSEFVKVISDLITHDLRTGNDDSTPSAAINVEKLFEFAPAYAEMLRLRHCEEPVNRDAGETYWQQAEQCKFLLGRLEEKLVDVIVSKEDAACVAAESLAAIDRFANQLRESDVVISFNYDTLVEQRLTILGREWNHGFEVEGGSGPTILKMHGSVDWAIVSPNATLADWPVFLYRKPNLDGLENDPDAQWSLHRIGKRSELSAVLQGIGRTRQFSNHRWHPALGGLGSLKPLHRVPGLGRIWRLAGNALIDANSITFIGFSLSEFDHLARVQLIGTVWQRKQTNRWPCRILVVDPNIQIIERYWKLYGAIEAFIMPHEQIDWERMY